MLNVENKKMEKRFFVDQPRKKEAQVEAYGSVPATKLGKPPENRSRNRMLLSGDRAAPFPERNAQK